MFIVMCFLTCLSLGLHDFPDRINSFVGMDMSEGLQFACEKFLKNNKYSAGQLFSCFATFSFAGHPCSESVVMPRCLA